MMGRVFMDDLGVAFWPAAAVARAVRAGEVSAVEMAEAYLERIGRLDARLAAYITVTGDELKI